MSDATGPGPGPGPGFGFGSGSGGAAATEVALRRRLDDLAATATVDAAAWEAIQSRIAAGGAGPSVAGRRRPTRRQLIAVAAAVIALACAVVLVQRRDGDQKVEMVDESTTTTVDRRGPSTTTSTTVQDDRSPSASMPGDQSTGSAAPDGTGPGSAGGADGQPGAGGTGPGGGDPGSGPSPGTSTPSPSGLLPDGRAPAVTVQASGYTLQATFWRDDSVHLNIWRPDRGYLTDWSRTDHPGQNCLAGESEHAFDFPEPGSHAYSWGMVRADAAEVRIVSTTGASTTAVLGAEVVPGLRPWIAPSPPGQVDHHEARDAAGDILHVATWSTEPDSWRPGFDAWPNTC